MEMPKQQRRNAMILQGSSIEWSKYTEVYFEDEALKPQQMVMHPAA